jgi:hypothetical protein
MILAVRNTANDFFTYYAQARFKAEMGGLEHGFDVGSIDQTNATAFSYEFETGEDVLRSIADKGQGILVDKAQVDLSSVRFAWEHKNLGASFGSDSFFL